MKKKEIKKKHLRCAYCKIKIEWGTACDSCGHKEDVDLGKVD